MENQNTNRTFMGVLSYLGFLSLIPLLVERNDPFIQFHAKQGINLCIIETLLSVACGILAVIPGIGAIGNTLSGAIGLLSLAMTILGIVAVCNGEEKPLPFIGGIKFIR